MRLKKFPILPIFVPLTGLLSFYSFLLKNHTDLIISCLPVVSPLCRLLYHVLQSLLGPGKSPFFVLSSIHLGVSEMAQRWFETEVP